MLIREAGAVAVRPGTPPQVLLVRSRSEVVEWIFPKGHVEPGETSEEAALRELREEAGVAGRSLGSIGQSRYRSGSENVLVDYFVVVAGESVYPHESRQQRWCTAEEAEVLLTFDDAKILLMRALRAISG